METSENIELLWRINKNLEEISSKIDRLISVYEFSRKHDLERNKDRVLGKSKIRREIYSLCDGTKTVQEIARRVDKSMPQVSKELTVLEEAKLVKPNTVGRRKYYVRMV